MVERDGNKQLFKYLKRETRLQYGKTEHAWARSYLEADFNTGKSFSNHATMSMLQDNLSTWREPNTMLEMSPNGASTRSGKAARFLSLRHRFPPARAGVSS